MARRGCAIVCGNASNVSARKIAGANNDTTGASSRFDMKCPIEPLKMTPVSPYNTACDEAPEKEGL
jgi:hypothetical protein